MAILWHRLAAVMLVGLVIAACGASSEILTEEPGPTQIVVEGPPASCSLSG